MGRGGFLDGWLVDSGMVAVKYWTNIGSQERFCDASTNKVEDFCVPYIFNKFNIHHQNAIPFSKHYSLPSGNHQIIQ